MADPVRSEVEVAAPQATVFAFLTDPDKIMRWLGTNATTEPHPGGIYLVSVGGKYAARGEFTEVIPVHRLAYSFGWEGRDEVPPGSSPSRRVRARWCASPIADCRTKRSAPVTKRAGTIIAAGWPQPRPAAIRGPIRRLDVLRLYLRRHENFAVELTGCQSAGDCLGTLRIA